MKTPSYYVAPSPEHQCAAIFHRDHYEKPEIIVPTGLRMAQRIAKHLNRNPGGLYIDDAINPTNPHGARIFATFYGPGNERIIEDVTILCHVSRGMVGKKCQDGAIFLEEDIVPLAIDQALQRHDLTINEAIGFSVGNVAISAHELDRWSADREDRSNAARRIRVSTASDDVMGKAYSEGRIYRSEDEAMGGVRMRLQSLTLKVK